MKKTLLLLIAVFFFSFMNNMIAQEPSTKGTDFWFGFVNSDNPYIPTYTFISSEKTTSGTISVPGFNWSQNFTVQANSTIQITMPDSIQPVFVEGTYNKAIHITSCDSVSVYAHNYIFQINDATIIYPTEALGDHYMNLNYSIGNGNDPGDGVVIVATQNNTQIEITPSVTTGGGNLAGVPYTIILNQGEIYQITNPINSVDLTGTTIRGTGTGECKPFAVLSGNRKTNVGYCGALDHLFEQLLPLKALGSQYILPPLQNRLTTEYRVMATQDGTDITIDGGAPITLMAGQYHPFTSDTASFVSANKPVMVMQYAQGWGCNFPGIFGFGDPFQILIHPMEQSLKKITFSAIPSNMNEYWLNIVVKTADVSSTMLNGTNIASSFSPVSSNPNYSYAQVSINNGNYTLISQGGALAYVYAWGTAESFGYCAGAALRDLSNNFTFTPNPTCIGSTVNFAAIPDSISSSYEWDFGDSSNTVLGLNTSHTYSGNGAYNVTLTRYRPNGCDVVVKKNVYIISPSVKLEQSDTTICGGTGLQLSVDVINDSLKVFNVNNCGDTTTSYQTAQFDSLTWSTGDTGSVITILPDSSMMVYVYGHRTDEICSSVDSIMINVVENPSFTINDFCEGESNSANVIGSTGGEFSIVSPLGDGTTIDAITGEIYNEIGGTTYTIQYETSGFCLNTSTQQVNVFPAANVSISADPLLGEPPLEVEFGQNSSNVDNLIWNFDDGEILNSMDSAIFHTFNNDGVYITTLIGTNGYGCEDSTNVKVIVAFPELQYTFPNVFTPNGDGSNDFFKLVNYQVISDLRIVILNRWGNIVFESDKVDFNWDGKVQTSGEDCTDGTYFFKAIIKGKNGEERQEQGFIHLSRGE